MKKAKIIKPFHEIIKEAALDYARKNAIASCGEIVETIWGDWKKPHKVMIYDVGAALVSGGFKIGDDTNEILEMFYYAIRLKSDGTPKDKEGVGIVLRNFKKGDGTIWKQSKEVINLSSYHWHIPKPSKRHKDQR